MSFTEILNLGQASDMVLRMCHEDDSPHLAKSEVQFWLNESERTMLGTKYWSFLDVTKIFVQSKDTTLGEDIAIGDTDFDVVDSSDLENAGTVLIDTNFITYTGNDGVTNLSGVSGIGAAYTSGTKVKQVYSLEDDLGISQFDKPISVHVGTTQLPYYDSREGFNNSGYTIYNGFLIVPYSTSEETITLKYKADIGAMTSDTDTFTTPSKYIGAHVQYATYMSKMMINDPTYQNHQREYMRLKNMFKAAYGNQTERKDKFLRSPYV